MNKDEVKMYLVAAGMKKDYRASWDSENGKGVILFKTRGDCTIIDGTLHGTQIILSDGLIAVWTSKVKKARVFCRDRGLKLREMTGECEFSLPMSTGDTFLTDWGARVKPVISPERKAQLASTLKSSILRSKNPIGSA